MTLEALRKNSRYRPCPPDYSQSVWKAMEEQRITKEDLAKSQKKPKGNKGIKNRGTKVHKDITKYDRNLAPSNNFNE